MPRTKTTPGQKQSITKAAVRNFKMWDAQREDKTETFRQCKNKKYWFVSDGHPGTVVSFYKRAEPKFLKIETNESGYHYVVTKEHNRTKTYYIHRLQSEVFEVYAYGNARNYNSLNGLEVHHTEADKRNTPDSEEILEPGTHDALFNKKTIPGMSDPDQKHFEYMERIAKIVQENTPDQAVIVFPGTGIVDGEETKDLTQVIYADDVPGVTDLVNQAIDHMNKPHPTYFVKDGYVVLYPGTLYTNTYMQKYHKAIIEHIKKADLEDHMEYDTPYPLTIKIDDDHKFEILTMKVPQKNE